MANEKRLIDANALKTHINGVSTHWLNDWSTLGVLAAVDKQPTVAAVEVVHGRWMFRKNWDFFVCSECSHESSNYSNYCPNCGAKMDGDGNVV